MAYRYINADKTLQVSPKQDYVNYIKRTVEEQFYNSTTWNTIEEESYFGSEIYQNVDVRITSVVDLQTGERVGDDFRRLLFKTMNHPIGLGRMYRFADNYWLTINTDDIADSFTSRVTVRRCNNVMRWIDDVGGYHEVPCSINYLITENRDYSTAGSAMVVPSGMITVQVQMNEATRKLQANQRFLFGNSDNWAAYRIEGGGIRNFNNMKTFDNLSAGLMMLSMAVDYVNLETDDVETGIANSEKIIYSLEINQSSISGNPSQTIQLDAIVKLNNQTVSRDVVWSSDNETVATINASGLVTFLSTGTAAITCHLLNNDAVFDICSATVGSSPVDNYQIIISPEVNFILEDSEKTWTVYLYKNGIQQADAFSFTLDSNTVPASNYIFTVIGANSFKIHNYERFLTDTLDITATSGSHTLVWNILLRGAW